MKSRTIEKNLRPDSPSPWVLRKNNSGVKLKRIRFVAKQVGSVFGRFLFPDWPPMLEIKQGIKDIKISNCSFLASGQSSPTYKLSGWKLRRLKRSIAKRRKGTGLSIIEFS